MKKSKQPYWKHGYGEVICSECDSCGADMREPLKRCYAEEHGITRERNACTECKYENGLCYCIRYTRDRMQELKSWGCFYKCEYIKPPEDKPVQLSFFD